MSGIVVFSARIHITAVFSVRFERPTPPGFIARTQLRIFASRHRSFGPVTERGNPQPALGAFTERVEGCSRLSVKNLAGPTCRGYHQSPLVSGIPRLSLVGRICEIGDTRACNQLNPEAISPLCSLLFIHPSQRWLSTDRSPHSLFKALP